MIISGLENGAIAINMWKEDRILIEQIICQDKEIAQSLEKTLLLIKKAAKKYSWHTPICFISYAWPHEQYPDEIWIQSFLKVLNQHLVTAGVSTAMDRVNNRIGGSVYGFIEQLEAADTAIVAGSRSLLLKHKIGKSNVCSELNKIREKPYENIFPLLLNGDIKTSFPAWFEGYTNIVDWKDDTYVIHLKELLRGLFKLTPGNKEFNKIWSDFENKHPELLVRLQENAVVLLKEQNINIFNQELKKSYNYFSRKLKKNIANTSQKQVLVDEHAESLFTPSFDTNSDPEHNIAVLSEDYRSSKFYLNRFWNKRWIIYPLCFFTAATVAFLFLGHHILPVDLGLEGGYSISFYGQGKSTINKSANTKMKTPRLIDNQEIVPNIMAPIMREKLHQLEEKRKSFGSGLLFVSISGFPGTGKTVLAQSYSDQYLKKTETHSPKLRWFIRSENQSTRSEDYKSLADRMGIKFNNDTPITTIISAVNAHLKNTSDFLLIFDNVKDYQDINEFVPNNANLNGQVIITSQLNDILPLEKKLNGFSISLNDGMNASESKVLLNKLTGLSEDAAMQALIERLGALPLAMVQAASYISRSKISYAEYLKLYDQQYDSLVKTQKLPETYQDVMQKSGNSAKNSNNTYETVIRFSLNKLTPEAQDILYLSAYLNPDNIPINLFLPLGLSEDRLNSILRELENNSLINISVTRDHFSVHRLIQDVARALLKENRLIGNPEELCIDKLLGLIHQQHRAQVVTEHCYYSKRFLIPHLEAVLISHAHSELSRKPIIQGIVDLALLYKAIGNAKQATEYYNKVLPKIESLFSNTDLAAEVYKGVGRAHQGAGYFEEAKRAYEKSYDIYNKISKSPSAEMAEILNDLGMIYRDIAHEKQQGASLQDNTYVTKAIDYLTQAVSMSELLPNQNKNKVRYLNNLGEAYRIKGYLKDAESNIQQALQLVHADFSDQNHRLIASAYFNLGNVYMDKHEYQSAKLYFEKAVEISSDENVAGKNHPLLARHMDALGKAWQNLGHSEEACEQFKGAYSILQSTNRGQKQLQLLIEKHIKACDLAK